MKTKDMSYYDQQNRTRVSEIEVGDKVLVKQRQVEKRTSAFRPTPMVITAKKGSLLTAEGSGKTITRNSSYFKKLHADFRLLNKETTYSYSYSEVEDSEPVYLLKVSKFLVFAARKSLCANLLTVLVFVNKKVFVMSVLFPECTRRHSVLS